MTKELSDMLMEVYGDDSTMKMFFMGFEFLNEEDKGQLNNIVANAIKRETTKIRGERSGN